MNDTADSVDYMFGADYLSNIAAYDNQRQQSAQQWRDTTKEMYHLPRTQKLELSDGSLTCILDDTPAVQAPTEVVHNDTQIYNVYNDTTNMQINNTEPEPRAVAEPPPVYHHAQTYTKKATEEHKVSGTKHNPQNTQLLVMYIAVAAVAVYALSQRSSRHTAAK